ncbi:MAG: hypothetical protein COB51_13565 [Moraxellaceae bacterium]|nr:MAG: hypothetical protein COB51_13565 [Moraxellaceae bacterium]
MLLTIFRFMPRLFIVFISILYLAACGGSSSPPLNLNSSEFVVEECVVEESSAPGDAVAISGVVSFDFVPHRTRGSALDYDAMIAKPARGVEVVLLDQCSEELKSSITNSVGEYRFDDVEANVEVSVRVKARLLSTGNASWDFSVTDNTNDDALYVLQGANLTSSSDDSSRDLHAASGWGGENYSAVRSAAPFAILDTVYDSIQLITSVDSAADFVSTELRWSTLNNTTLGDLAEGDIASSFYDPDSKYIYLLGRENDDTDEYDQHVIAHEFWHYFEDNFSRTDSIGGPHGGGDLLDFRVAYSEGAGNAFSGMVLDDPIYVDSLGDGQLRGFTFDLEENVVFVPGWYSESSVQSILYDLYDSNSVDDGVDTIDNAFFEFYSVVTSAAFKNSSTMTGIHLFLSELKAQFPNLSAEVDALANQQDITVIDAKATDETNDGGKPSVLPLYKTVSVGGPAVEVCSINDFGVFNKLGNTQFVELTISSSASYSLSVNRVSGMDPSDPDFGVWRNGALVDYAGSMEENSEEKLFSLTAGVHIIEIFEYGNMDDSQSGDVCFEFEVN